VTPLLIKVDGRIYKRGDKMAIIYPAPVVDYGTGEPVPAWQCGNLKCRRPVTDPRIPRENGPWPDTLLCPHCQTYYVYAQPASVAQGYIPYYPQDMAPTRVELLMGGV